MPLSAGHRSGNIGHRPPDFSGLLEQDRSKCKCRGVCGDFGLCLWVKQHQHCGLCQLCFYMLKGLLLFRSPTQAHLELNSSLRGSLSSAKWGENLLSWFAILINLRNFVTFRGGSSSTMAEIFSRSGCMPLSSITCPRNLIFLWLNWHFSAFKVTPTFSIRSSYQAWVVVFLICSKYQHILVLAYHTLQSQQNFTHLFLEAGSAVIAGSPSRFVFRPRMTKIVCDVTCPWCLSSPVNCPSTLRVWQARP